MDQHHLSPLTRALISVPSRRDVLRGLAGVGFGLGVYRLPEGTEAKKKGKKKPKKNAFNCLAVGQKCAGRDGKCCSGICQGKRPKKGKQDKSKCVTHNAGICIAEADSCTAGVEVPCNPTNPSCFCTLTTGNAGFCAAFSGGPAGHCRVCRKDTDCEPEFGEGAACLLLAGVCTSLCLATGRTACAPPCA
jgi:hypothetical protein